MQKRDPVKQGGAPGVGTAKRGRPFGSGNQSTAASNAALAAAAAESAAPATLFGPSLQVHSAFAEQNNKRIVLALQSGLKGELTWALNALTLLSFKEKDEVRKDATPLAKIPGLLDALLQVIDDWHDITQPRILAKKPRLGLLGDDSAVTGFGNEYETLSSGDPVLHASVGPASSNKEMCTQKIASKPRPSSWSIEEDIIFNFDEEGLAEKQMSAVSASNIVRNFSFMTDNEIAMAQNRHCLETMFQCLEEYVSGLGLPLYSSDEFILFVDPSAEPLNDEELVTNALETIMNLGPLLDLRIFSSSKTSYININEKRAVQAVIRMLDSAVKAWHCAAAELVGRLMLNPENEPFILPFTQKIYGRLVGMLNYPYGDAQAAAIGSLYNLAEVNVDCRLKLATERWVVDRLLKVIKTHPVPEICRKASLILENLALEPQNKPLLLAYENAFAEMLFSETRYSDTFARILYELTARSSNKVASARGIWGAYVG